MTRKIGLCREKTNRWERRVPLVPEDVRQLVHEHGFEIVVQGSPARVFSNEAYAAAGALIDDGITGCGIVMSVNAPPAEVVRPGGIYLCFVRSRGERGDGVPSLDAALLRRLKTLGCTLIDCGSITDERGRDMIYIGRYSGLAGMVDTLWALGQRLKYEGYDTPFSLVRQAHQYENLAAMRRAIIGVGEALRDGRLPSALRPLVFGFVGDNGVSKGAQEIFDLLPHRELIPAELAAGGVFDAGSDLLKVVFPEERTIKPKDDSVPGSLGEFYRHPKRYVSDFGRYLDRLSVLLNCVPRRDGAPRLITKADAARMWKNTDRPRLRVIGDLSETLEGGVEFASVATQPDAPAYVYEPESDDIAYGIDGHGPVVVSLAEPARELPEETSAAISHALMPLMDRLAQVDPAASSGHGGLPMSLRPAVVLWRGKLTPAYEYLRDILKKSSSDLESEDGISPDSHVFKGTTGGTAGKKVLILGGGSNARPLVRYLLEQTRHEVICADQAIEMGEELFDGYSRGRTAQLELDSRADLERLVSGCDFVVSLLPYRYHQPVAELCIMHGKHLVTTSYTGDAMRALDLRARKAGVMLVNEMGVIPGIDHMIAMRAINRVKDEGGRVISLNVYGGALPAPEAALNPLGYRFSWSMHDVLLAGRMSAKYQENGRTVEIPAGEVFRHHRSVQIPGNGTFETYPSRNAIIYKDIYGLSDAKTVFRGTLRNPGWCGFWERMFRLGWADDAARSDLDGMTWRRLMRTLVPGNGDLATDLCASWNVAPDSAELRCAEWLGFLGNEAVPDGAGSLLDLMCIHLQKKLAYRPGERDMILLHQEIIAEYPGRRARITSTLTDYGIPNGDHAVARTVGLPIAIFIRKFFEGRIPNLSGVLIPVAPEVYTPILAELEALNIRCVEHVEVEKIA